MHAALQDNAQSQQAAYGQALAKGAAREAVEAMFRKDLVSLRAIAQATANNPSVLRVSMRSVEQETLVQAGPVRRDLPQTALSFESTIALHDSIVGAVVVTIESRHFAYSHIYTFLFFAILLFTAVLFIWTAWKQGELEKLFDFIAKEKAVLQSLKAANKHAENDETKDESESENETADGQAVEHFHSYLALCVKNVMVLQDQLNGETFRNTFSLLEKRIHQVGKPYGLQSCRWVKDRYLLTFSANENDTPLFHAACAGRLMLDLLGIINQVPLDLAAQISLEEAHLTQIKFPFVGLAIDTHNDLSSLENKVEYIQLSEDDDRQLISRFSEPYAELLKKQTNQLQLTLVNS